MTSTPRRRSHLPGVAGLLVLLVVLGFAVPATAATDPDVSWGVYPAGGTRTHFDATTAPGTSVTDSLSVVNRSSASITLRLYAGDAFTTPTGGLDILPASTRSVDLGSWITLAKSVITVPSQQRVDVPFVVRVPTNATPGDHIAGIVTSLVTPATPGAVRVDHRLGSRFYLRVIGALHPALAVSHLHVHYAGSLDPLSAGTATATYTVTNTGNVRLHAHQTVTFSGLLGLLSRSGRVADLPELLPGDSITQTARVHGVWPTLRTTARVTLHPFTAADEASSAVPAASASAALWTWPLGQLLAVLGLAGLAAGLWYLRRRQARRVEAAIAAAVESALTR